ncbi:MAG: hypothetical protein M3R15_34125 [Acidobacteriota bacterium]|nr:hypothetical protein [Acidobacteriota bacterium]
MSRAGDGCLFPQRPRGGVSSRNSHFYEALLATLAIFAWHFYYTIYNPHVFPLSTTMVTGRISHEEMERDHALELRMLEENAAKKEPGA